MTGSPCHLRSTGGLALAAVLAGFGGCAGSDSAGAAADGPGGVGGFGQLPQSCTFDEDCVAVSSTCCACPSLAVTAGSGFAEQCRNVDCTGGTAPPSCPRVRASCEENLCVLRCERVASERVCSFGFLADSAGCLVDACRAGSSTPECQLDGECVRVPADCCGCERGGRDTSVPQGRASSHVDSLACPPAPACPGVNTCNASAAPACVSGSCALVAPPAEGSYCGADFGACGAGQVCVLNHPAADELRHLGVGICSPR